MSEPWRSRTLTIARTSGAIIFGFTIAYLLFAALPFYGNGIHRHSYAEIAGSFVDVKGYPPFNWLGGPAQGVAMLSAGLVRPVGLALTPVLLATLVVARRSLRRAEATLWLTTAVVSIAVLALTWEALGIITAWLAD